MKYMSGKKGKFSTISLSVRMLHELPYPIRLTTRHVRAFTFFDYQYSRIGADVLALEAGGAGFGIGYLRSRRAITSGNIRVPREYFFGAGLDTQAASFAQESKKGVIDAPAFYIIGIICKHL